MTIPIAAGALVLTVWALAGLRILREDRRLLVIRLGRRIGYAGPGLVLLFRPVDSGLGIGVGDVLELTSPEEAQRDECSFPVQVVGKARVGEKVAVTGFTRAHALVARVPSAREARVRRS